MATTGTEFVNLTVRAGEHGETTMEVWFNPDQITSLSVAADDDKDTILCTSDGKGFRVCADIMTLLAHLVGA